MVYQRIITNIILFLTNLNKLGIETLDNYSTLNIMEWKNISVTWIPKWDNAQHYIEILIGLIVNGEPVGQKL